MMRSPAIPFVAVVLALSFSVASAGGDRIATIRLKPKVTLTNAAARDQDDLCIWVHPDDPSLSTFIASDKYAGRLFVYDVDGALLQTVVLPGMPGNVDVRYGFPLGGETVDIVAHNDRDHDKVVLHRVDPATRHLVRVDDDAISTGPNYGLTLYHSPKDGSFHVFTTSKSGDIRQLRLSEAGGRVSGTPVRSWSLGAITEGCVADDETGRVYFAEEDTGIWDVGAEPDDPTAGASVARVGDASGLRDDVEGLAIYYAADGKGYLIASSQGDSTFKVYEREAPHALVTTFRVTGTQDSDGVDVLNLPLGARFPHGVFLCHNDNRTPKSLEACAWEDLGLTVDATYWNPRARGTATAASWGGGPSPDR